MFKKITFTISTFLLLLLVQTTLAASHSTQILTIVSDSIQGNQIKIKTSHTKANKIVNFFIKYPSGKNLRIKAITSISGEATITLKPAQTQELGTYSSRAILLGVLNQYSPATFFTISAPNADPDKSFLQTLTTSNIPADNKAQGQIKITLLDRNNTPVIGHQVKLIAKRNNDQILPAATATTDSNGSHTFNISSRTNGIAEFRIIDTSTNTIINSIASLTFATPQVSTNTSSSWSQLFSKQFSQALNTNLTTANSTAFDSAAAEKIDSIKIVTPANVQLGEPFTVTVKVLTTNGKLAHNFNKTIIFTVDGDPNAVIPLESTGYTFDKGETSHTFENAFILNSTGAIKITVDEIDTFSFSDTTIVNVQGQTQSATTPILITSPTTDSKFFTNSVTFNATAEANFDYKVFDNGVEVIKTFSDNNGKISFDLNKLENTKHEIIISQLDSNAQVIASSDPITITIENIATKIDNISIDPADKIEVNSPFIITIHTTDPITNGLLKIDGISDQLIPDKKLKNTYYVKTATPNKSGVYQVNFSFTNSGGKKQDFLNETTLTVIPKKIIIPVLKNFTATAQDKSVILKWDQIPKTALTDLISIDIYQSQNAFSFTKKPSLNVKSDTKQITIPNLVNGKIYYFYATIIARDQTVGAKSSLISITPNPDKIIIKNIKISSENNSLKLKWAINNTNKLSDFLIQYGINSGEFLENKTIIAKANIKDYQTIIRNLVPNETYFLKITARTAIKDSLSTSAEFSQTVTAATIIKGAALETQICSQGLTPITGLQVLRQGSERIVNWTPLKNVDAYQVYAGESLDKLYPITLVRNASSARLLLPNPKQYYYFAVKAVCTNSQGQVIKSASAISSIIQVGSNTIWIGILALISFVIIRISYFRKD